MQNLGPTLDLLNQNLHRNVIPKLFLYTLNFKTLVKDFLGSWSLISDCEIIYKPV